MKLTLPTPILSFNKTKTQTSTSKVYFIFSLLFLVSFFGNISISKAVIKTFGSPPGSATTTNPDLYTYSTLYSGMANSYRYASNAAIYGAEEFGLGGTINSYAVYKYYNGSTPTIDSVYIFMKEVGTTKSSTSAMSLEGFTEVFRGSFPNTKTANGWETVNLTTPFVYSGTQNLQIIVVQRRAAAGTGANFYVSYASSSGYNVAYHYNNTTTWSNWLNTGATSPSKLTATSTTTAYRPYIQLDITPFPCTGVPPVTTAVASNTTPCANEEVTFTGKISVSPTSGNTYYWDTSSSPTGPWVLAHTTTNISGEWNFIPPVNEALYYRVRTSCTSGAASDTSTAVLVTTSSPLTVPYNEDFETTTPGTNVKCASVSSRFSPSTTYSVSDYWKIIAQTGTIYTSKSYPSGNNYLVSGVLNGTYSGGTGSAEFWFTPAIELKAGKTYRFTYWYASSSYAVSGYTSTTSPVHGMYYASVAKKDSVVAIKPDLIATKNTTHLPNEGDFSVPVDGLYHMAIKGFVNNFAGYYVALSYDNISLIELEDCNTATSFSSGGKVVSSAYTLCALPDTITLDINDKLPYKGLEYQWQSATGSPTTFADIPGLTGFNVEHSIAVGGNYFLRCKVTCTSTGITTFTDTIKIVTIPIALPYIEDFESVVEGQNIECAGSSHWSTSNLYTKTVPFATTLPGLVNHTPGGKGYLHFPSGAGYSTSYLPVYWFTPGLALTAGKAYEVEYWYSNSASTSFSSYATIPTDMGIKVGTTQNVAGMTINAGSDTVIYTNSSGTPSYDLFKRGFIAPTTGTYYVGIWASHNGYTYNGFAVDDIGVSQLPSCNAKPVAGVTKTSIKNICTSDSAQFSIPEVSLASDLSFQWQTSTSSTGPWIDVVGASSSVYVTPVLSIPGKYYYRCIVTCSAIESPNSDTSVAEFVTVGALDVPYSEDFEDASTGVNVSCASHLGTWTRGTTQYWDIKASLVNTSATGVDNHTPGGKKYLFSGYYNGPYYAANEDFFWFSPALKMNANDAYEVSFWYNSPGSGLTYSGYKLGVYAGQIQNLAGMNIRTGKDSLILVDVNNYKQFIRSFVAPTTGNYYVGIKTAHTGYNYPGIAIDDINVKQLPACTGTPVAGYSYAAPDMLCAAGTVVVYLDQHEVASKLNYQWQSTTDTTIIAFANVTGGSGANTATLTSPSLTTTTYFRCIVTCATTGLADTSSIIKVNYNFIEPPYFEDFENEIVGRNIPCAAIVGAWANASTTGNWTLKGSKATSTVTHTSNNTTPNGGQYLFAGSSATASLAAPYHWFTPAIRLQKDSSYEFKFKVQGGGAPAASTSIAAFFGSAQTIAGMTNNVGSEIVGINTPVPLAYTGRITAPATANYYFGIRVKHATAVSNSGGIAIDDIGLEILPQCTGVPTVDKAIASTHMLCAPDTVTLTTDLDKVTKAAKLSYTWYASTLDSSSGFTPISSALPTPDFKTGTISTTSWFRIVVKCEATGDSAISAPVKVNIGAIIPPYFEDFETVIAPNNVPCSKVSTTWSSTYWYTYSAPFSISYPWIDNHTPGGTKYLYAGYYNGYTSGKAAGGYWFTPAIEFTAGNEYQFSMWYSGTGYNPPTVAEITVQYGPDQTDSTMPHTIIDPFTFNTKSYKQIKKRFIAAVSGNLYIGIKVNHDDAYSYPAVVIDDIGLQNVPVCDDSVIAGSIAIESAHLCNIGESANLDLEGVTLASSIQYDWYTAPSVSGTYTFEGSSLTLPYTTAPINTDTWYKCVVTCLGTGATDTTLPIRITVGGMELPYVEDFEKVDVGEKPLCTDATYWGLYNYDGWRVLGSAYVNLNNNTPGGSKYLVAGYYMGTVDTYSPITDNNYWFTPGFKLEAKYKYQLSFQYISSNPSYTAVGNRWAVSYGRSQSVGGMTGVVFPLKWYNNSNFELADTTFTVPADGIYYLGFQKANGLASGTPYGYYGVVFDDINLNYAPCEGTPTAGKIIANKPAGTGYCLGEMVTLTDTGATTYLVPGIQYQWYRRPSGSTGSWNIIAGATTNELKGDSLIGYEYSFVVVCSNSNDSVRSATFNVPQLPVHPAVNITPNSSPVMYCAGDSVLLNATDYPGAIYDWMNEDGVIFGWKHSDIAITYPGKYYVKVTSPLSACPTYSDTIVVEEINPGYSVTITKPIDSFTCKGNSIVLTAISSKAGVSFTWSKDGVIIPGATSSIYSVNETGVYRVYAFDGVSTCQAGSRSIKITVKENPVAVIKVPGGTLTGCALDGIKLNAGNEGFSYKWLFNGSTITGATDSIYTAKIGGVYEVIITNAAGCATTSNKVSVVIMSIPAPIITQAKIGKNIELGLSTTYIGYQWYRDGVLIPAPAGTSATYLATDGAVYRVVVKDFNGCEAEAIIDLRDVLSMDNTADVTIKVFPNPTTGLVTITSPVKVKVTLMDITGKTLIEDASTPTFDMSKYADGVYLIRVTDEQGTILIPQQRINKVSTK